MDDSQLKGAIRERVEQLLTLAKPLCKQHRVSVPAPLVRFDLRGQAAGQARWPGKTTPELRFNLAVARRHRADFIATTVPHEVAHLLTVACHGRTRPHGPEWQAMMGFLGIDAPQRCHDYSLDESEVRRQRRWAYLCACQRHELSTTRHRRMQTGAARYHCRRCGDLLRAEDGD